MKPSHPKIRQLLHQYQDGFTVLELAERLDRNAETIYHALKAMPDSYIDRWTEAQYQAPAEAVWCVVIAPKNCPKPNAKHTKLRRLVK